MAKKRDILEQISENPRGDWKLDNLVRIAEKLGLTVRAPSHGSHFTFSSPYLATILTVPYKRPIKPVYVKRFCRLVESHAAAAKGEDHD